MAASSSAIAVRRNASGEATAPPSKSVPSARWGVVAEVGEEEPGMLALLGGDRGRELAQLAVDPACLDGAAIEVLLDLLEQQEEVEDVGVVPAGRGQRAAVAAPGADRERARAAAPPPTGAARA